MPQSGSVGAGPPTSRNAAQEPIAYILKRYPRLSETFILNEIRAMERLGARLHIISLLPPEPPPHHPMVAEVEAPVHILPKSRGKRWGRIVGAHAATLAAAPMRYARAVGRSCLWSLRSPQPSTVWKQFMRGGFIAATCRRHGVRHIHAHFANAPAAAAQFASLMSGIPFSFTAHAKDLYLTPKPVISKRGRAAQFVATCTGYNVRYLEPLLGDQADKIQLVYHGIDLGLFNARAPTQPRDGRPPLILSVGRLVPKKGHDDLITACALLRDAGIDFRCQIVGEGPLRAELKTRIAEAGLSGRVTLEGAMTHARLIALYADSRCFRACATHRRRWRSRRHSQCHRRSHGDRRPGGLDRRLGDTGTRAERGVRLAGSATRSGGTRRCDGDAAGGCRPRSPLRRRRPGAAGGRVRSVEDNRKVAQPARL